MPALCGGRSSYDLSILCDVVAAGGARAVSIGRVVPARVIRVLATGLLGFALLGACAAIAPRARASTPAATSISATSGYTCASMSTGTVECWGKSYLPKTKSNVPRPVNGISGAIAVATGARYNCALLASHRIVCWGDDGYGQLGDGRTQDSGRPVEVVGISSAVAISAGRTHACAVLTGGAVKCWGHNVQGALGNGSSRSSTTPVTVHGISNAIAISAGLLKDTTCALLATGEVRCWGSNHYGQLGNGRTASANVPVAVTGITDAVAIASSGQHACAVLASGAIDCWGDNDRGQLGDASHHNSSTPVPVTGVTAATAVVAAPYGYTCAVVRPGSVYCWGHNSKNQLGNGLYPVGSVVPVPAVGITTAVALTAGMGHACALLASGGAACWGYDDYGQLGKGGGRPRISNPVAVRFGASAPPAPRVRAHQRGMRRHAAHAGSTAGRQRPTGQARKR